MSWWISLEDHTAPQDCDYGTDAPDACPKPCYPAVDVARHEEGGTYAQGGTTMASLNVTYNYGKLFDFDSLRGRRGGETLADLAFAVANLGTETDPDYWKPAPGNVRRALSILESWAQQHPDAIWRVN